MPYGSLPQKINLTISLFENKKSRIYSYGGNKNVLLILVLSRTCEQSTDFHYMI